MLCCHPSLPAASQIALTLRAVGGLSTAEIARALLGSEQGITRRITRAKKAIKDSGLPFELPSPGELDGRLSAYRAARAAINLQQERYLNRQVDRLQAGPERAI